MKQFLAVLTAFWVSMFPSSTPADLTMTTTPLDSSVLGVADESLVFRVNIPAIFSEAISAPNVVYSLTAGNGISISNLDTQTPTISTTAITALVAGTGITVEGNKITSTITQGYTSLEAGTGISIDGNKITNTLSIPTPDYTQSGWTRTGTTVGLTTITDSVTVGALTANTITITNGNAILPNTDLGSDLGSSTYRFNNLWVANINSNSSQSFSGQTTFSYPPTDTTIDEASVLINPTSSTANGQLLGLAIAGYQRALIDEDGDLILGYNSLTSAPPTDYPLDIYGHSGTRVSFVDTSGNLRAAALYTTGDQYGTHNLYFGNNYRLASNVVNSGDLAFMSGASSKLYMTSTGNIGIGTTSPTSKLHVMGDITLPSAQRITNGYNYWYTDASGSLFYFGSGTNAVNFSTVANGNLLFSPGGTEAMRIGGGGNVGIGTTSPQAALNIAKDGSGGELIRLSGYASQPTLYYLNVTPIVSSGTVDYRWQVNDNANGAKDIFYIDSSSGNVGIGTTSPLALTHIKSSAGRSSSGQEVLRLSADLGSGNPGSGPALTFGDSASGVLGKIVNAAESDNGSGLGFWTMNSGFQVAEKVRISGSGNVGIGTTSPIGSLDIYGSNKYGYFGGVAGGRTTEVGVNVSGYAVINGKTNRGGVLSISDLTLQESGGNVGIGTTSPATKMELYTSANENIGLRIRAGSVSGGSPFMEFYADGADADWRNWKIITNNTVSGALRFQRGTTMGGAPSTDVMTLSKDGNVGIGTTSPSQKLDVSGTGSFSDNVFLSQTSGKGIYFHADSTGAGITRSGIAGISFKINGTYNNPFLFMNNTTELMRLDTAGNLGIGTTAPGYKLQVGNAGDGSEARANAWNALSDSTFKTNITPLTNSLDKIMQLEGVSFAWKSNGKENLGLIAQDVQRVFPELVATDSDGILSLNYDGLSAPIIQAIKEQQTHIDDLRGDSLKVEMDGISSLVAILQDMIREIGDRLTAMTVKFSTKESHQEKLCVGMEGDEICLDKEQIKAVIDNLPSPAATSSTSPSATPEPSPSPSLEPSPSASMSASPTPSSTP